jgi:hypothetical protein
VIGQLLRWGLQILQWLAGGIFEVLLNTFADLLGVLLANVFLAITAGATLVIITVFPFSAIAITGWTAWWGIPLLTRKALSSSSSPKIKWLLKFINKTLRPLALCIGVAATPHTLFLLVWQAIPFETRLHSWLGPLLRGYQSIVFKLHEKLGPYEKLGTLWWAAIVLSVGWVAVELSRPWLLDRFLSSERYFSRVAFTLLIAAYFTATTAGDRNIPRQLEVVVQEMLEAEALRETADAVTKAISADPRAVDRAYAVPDAIYQWPERDYEDRNPKRDESAWRRVRAATYKSDPTSRLSDDDRREVEREVARDVAIRRVNAVLSERPNAQSKPDRSHSASAFPDWISTFQQARNQADELDERAKVARTAAVEAFVHAAGINVIDIPIVKDLFKKMLEACAEAIASKTIDQVPADLILADTSKISERIAQIVRPETWKRLANKLIGADHDERTSPVGVISTEIIDDVRKRAEEHAKRNNAIEDTRRAVE